MIDMLRGTPLYRLAHIPGRRLELVRWQRNGRVGATPHLWKRRMLTRLARSYGLSTLVETGTYMGEMTAAMRGVFAEIYSVELSDALYAGAAKRFASDSHVHLLHGDSADILKGLLPRLSMPCLFWLDAHYSAGVTARGGLETPVESEIHDVLSSGNLDHVILIDDAELFTGTGDYPTISHVKDMVTGLRPSWLVSVSENLILIHPPKSRAFRAADLAGKQIAVVSHVVGEGHAQDMIEYARQQGAAKTLFIGHPLEYVEGARGSHFRYLVGSRLAANHEVPNYRLPPIAQYFLQSVLTVYWMLRLRQRWDIVIACDNLNTLAVLLLHRLGLVRRVAYYTIDYVPERFPNRLMNETYHRIDKFCVAHADVTWNVSDRICVAREQIRGLHRTDYPNQATVPISIRLTEFPNVPFEATEAHTLIYSGGLLQHQGVQLAIDAIPLIVQRLPDFRFIITGAGPHEQSLKRQVEELAVGAHVKFLGYLDSRAELRQLLAMSAVGAAMYSRELDRWSQYADPSKIKDYLAAGLPIVTTDVTPIAADLVRRHCGFVIPYQAAAFASIVLTLMEDQQVRREYRENSLAYAAEFDFSVILGRALADPRLRP